ncbi:tRNA (adenine(22)-N(1))-methyltransferase [Pseudocolwellia sp. HL-MZ7]|uniref:tRNA (adenine(22)-N(1))-methyltransferase n=1 Tax=Pseudocolwellia sp. HL-MZ7 TaxID=3400627 RepID=UPI003CEDFE34
MKLSKRLKQIEQMVTAEYDHIWDCCCDHGFLGAALLSRLARCNADSFNASESNNKSQIHFVDIVPELMAQLENKLEQFYPPSKEIASWKTHCIDVATLPLAQYKGKPLVIIAGVGGDLMMEFINAIYAQHQSVDIDFLLCPVHHQFALRQRLIELDFGLKKEVLVEENKRFYEVIYVSTKKADYRNVDAVGKELWEYNTEQQAQTVKKYLSKTLRHYQRMQQGSIHNVEHIIDAYKQVLI